MKSNSDPDQNTEAVQAMMRTLFSAQRVLRALAPDYKWTYGGNLVGDFGEFLAINNYDLTLASRGAEGYDATDKAGCTVQVKTIHASSQIGFRGKADKLLVIGVTDDGEWEEIYFGSFEVVAEQSSFSKRDNKRTITKTKLRKLQSSSES